MPSPVRDFSQGKAKLLFLVEKKNKSGKRQKQNNKKRKKEDNGYDSGVIMKKDIRKIKIGKQDKSGKCSKENIFTVDIETAKEIFHVTPRQAIVQLHSPNHSG